MEVLAQIPKVHLHLMNVLTQDSTGTHILLLLMRVLTKIREVLVRTGQILTPSTDSKSTDTCTLDETS